MFGIFSLNFLLFFYFLFHFSICCCVYVLFFEIFSFPSVPPLFLCAILVAFIDIPKCYFLFSVVWLFLICFDTWPFTKSDFFSIEPALVGLENKLLNIYFIFVWSSSFSTLTFLYCCDSSICFILGSSSLCLNQYLFFCIFLSLSYYIWSGFFCHTSIVYHIYSPSYL